MNLHKMLQKPKETTNNESDKSKGFNDTSSDNSTFASKNTLPINLIKSNSNSTSSSVPDSKTSIAVGAHSRSLSITSTTTSTTTMTATTTTTTTRTTSAPNQDISSSTPGNSSTKTYSTPILSYNTTTVVSSTIEPNKLTGISETETENEFPKSASKANTNSTTTLSSTGKERNNDDTSLMPPPKLFSLGSYNNSNNNSTSNDANANTNTSKVLSNSNSPLIDRNISSPLTATSPFTTNSGSYFTSRMTAVSTSDIVTGLGINGGNSNSTATLPQSPASTLVSASNYISASGVSANIGNREVVSANSDDHEHFNVHSPASNCNNNNNNNSNPLNQNKIVSRRPSGHSSILSSFIEQTSQLSAIQNQSKGGNNNSGAPSSSNANSNGNEGISTPSSASHADFLSNDRVILLQIIQVTQFLELVLLLLLYQL
ncbi:unnamed protein product [[Candida] boidinii]|nr:unnamed protein product [[Candida] boidinii]